MEDKKLEKCQSLAITRLYNAAHAGDVPCLLELLENDPLILNRHLIAGRSFVQSPLHIASNLGHSEFAKQLLDRMPELAQELDQSKKWSPLHFASAKGYLEIVKLLVEASPNMCFTRNQDGKNPVHVAAMNGKINVLHELVSAQPRAALERTNDGDTVLHLCVKHNQLEALMELAAVIDDGDELLNSKDEDGNTVLHLAVSAKQPELVNFLLKNKRMEKDAINKNGSTAMDVCKRSRNDVGKKKIRRSLMRAKIVRAKGVLTSRRDERGAKLVDHRNALMVVASLIATMAFQVGVNPPGGVWQDNKPDTTSSLGPNPSPYDFWANAPHSAGASIMACQEELQYTTLMVLSSVALVSSLSVILLLISGLPCQKIFVGVLMITMWIAITAITMTYGISITYLTSFQKKTSAVKILLNIWPVLIFILLFVHVGRYMVMLIKKLVRLGNTAYHKCFSQRATAYHRNPPV